jgi:hypothetical protein
MDERELDALWSALASAILNFLRLLAVRTIP